MRKILLALSFVAVGTLSAASAVVIHKSIFTGDEFLEFDSDQRRIYAAGLIDGMFLAPFFGAPRSDLKWFEDCVEGMQDDQIAAMLQKQLRDHPSSSRRYAHTAMYAALRATCPKTVAPGP
jgi:hypothetical protein